MFADQNNFVIQNQRILYRAIIVRSYPINLTPSKRQVFIIGCFFPLCYQLIILKKRILSLLNNKGWALAVINRHKKHMSWIILCWRVNNCSLTRISPCFHFTFVKISMEIRNWQALDTKSLRKPFANCYNIFYIHCYLPSSQQSCDVGITPPSIKKQ